MRLTPAHAALVEKRTIFTKTRVSRRSILKRSSNRKLGTRVTKGRWKGMPIYTLTLEERATCPTSCNLWDVCFGNNMRWAERITHGPALERALPHEVRELAERHPGGFVVRLHVLGDFYSLDYARLWKQLVRETPQLHVFGYTHTKGQLWRELGWSHERWVIRHSDNPGRLTAHAKAASDPGDLVCPEQTGRVKDCGSCALCWNTSVKDITFLEH